MAEAEAQSQVQQFLATPSQNTYYPNCKAVRQAGARQSIVENQVTVVI